MIMDREGPRLSTSDPETGPVSAEPRLPMSPIVDVSVTENFSCDASCGAYAEYRYIVPLARP